MRYFGVLFMVWCVAMGSARAADVPPQKFVVFFEEWSARLDDPAQAVIAHAADWVKGHPGNVAHVGGFADPTGSKQANALLSELRAQMVVDQLQADGIAPNRISQRGHGSVQFALTSQESRRVEVSITGR